jgi:hypothetical protein
MMVYKKPLLARAGIVSAAILAVLSTSLSNAGANGRFTTTESSVPSAPEGADMSTTSAASSRLVPNWGFEESLPAPARWTVDAPGGSAQVVDQPVRSGLRALRTVDSSASEGVSVRSQRLAVMPGETLTVAAYSQRVGTGDTAGWLYLEFFGADGARLPTVAADGTRHNGVVATEAPNGDGWQRVQVAGVAPVHAVTADVLIYSSLAETGTTVWDDVNVTTLPPPERAQLPNAGFEENRGIGATSHWTLSTGATIVSTGQRSGRQALRTVDATNDNGVSAYSRRLPVTVGWTVNASVWANADSGGAGWIYLEFRDANGAYQDNTTWRPRVQLPNVTGWQSLSVQGTVPAGAQTVDLLVYSSYADTGTTVWDDATLRTSADAAYDPSVGNGSVLFVGDERVESYTGLTRVMRPGTPAGNPVLEPKDDDPKSPGIGKGVVFESTASFSNPRPGGTVLPTSSGYEMWMNTGQGTVHATSVNGWDWPVANRQLTVLTTSAGKDYDEKSGPAAVVNNPRYGQAGQPKYLGLASISGPVSRREDYPTDGLPDRRGDDYYAFSSNDGINWVLLNEEIPAIRGHDTVNVAYDQDAGRFVASSKGWIFTKDDSGVSHYERGARTVLVSTSTDFVTWTKPTPVHASDLRDYDTVAADNPGTGGATVTSYGRPVKSSDIYSMPVFRYGEQYLALPTIDETTYAATDVWPDVGRAHLELASSQHLYTWSRPNRQKLVEPGALGEWNWGFHLAATQMLTVRDEVWLYYGSFAGKHGCPELTTEPEKGCQITVDNMGSAHTGRVIWPKDRFMALHAAAGGGVVTTRTLAPQAGGDQLRVNVATGAGNLKVEVLDVNGNPVPGYTLADATAVQGDTSGQTVTWGTRNTLPSGPIRLRFNLSAGDLYSYAIF